jgi:hypothetical protein
MANTVATAADGQEILSRPSVRSLLDEVRSSLRVEGGTVHLEDAGALRDRGIDRLAHAAVFGGDEDVRDTARWLIGEVGSPGHGRSVPASIHELYIARGQWGGRAASPFPP